MSNIDKAAEHLGANALKMIKLILLKHDAAIIEASQEAIEAAVLDEREACAQLVESLDGCAQYFPHVPDAIRARGGA